MRITQCYISESIKLFADGFRKRWNLLEYTDIHSPCIFMGVYSDSDIKTIKDHTSFKLIKFTGADSINISKLNDSINLYITANEILRKNLSETLFPVKYLTTPNKDYSKFSSYKLGGQIYCFLRQNGENLHVNNSYDVLQQLIKYFGKHKFLLGRHGNTMETMIEEYYKKCFINLQLNPIAGFTSALEMAHMGRMNISNHPAPFCLSYKDKYDIMDLIECESKKIGTIQNEVCESVKAYMHNSDDWLHTEYWQN